MKMYSAQCLVWEAGWKPLPPSWGLWQTHLKEKWADSLRYLKRHCHFLVAQPQTDGNGGLI